MQCIADFYQWTRFKGLQKQKLFYYCLSLGESFIVGSAAENCIK